MDKEKGAALPDLQSIVGLNPMDKGKDLSLPNLQSIASLNPGDNKWTIKCSVLQKGDTIFYNNIKGYGSRKNVTFVDEDGTTISATLFNELIELFDDKLLQGKTYYISNGFIKYYRSCKEISFNKSTTVREAINEQQIGGTVKHNFVPLKMTRPYLQSHDYIDIVVLLVGAGPPLNSIRRNYQTTLTRRQLQIIDSEFNCAKYKHGL
ncbi:replication protein A 70 kDa DNA-binding subunit B-like isoform X1 [Tasmannia lanceolata]|uniref:replication protein A 70 kDa DNA-binding subunit B-like isoform X1 n=1 Tax=Tasmannia lanceolata TaxID=3420 RepID=UPI004063E2E4